MLNAFLIWDMEMDFLSLSLLPPFFPLPTSIFIFCLNSCRVSFKQSQVESVLPVLSRVPTGNMHFELKGPEKPLSAKFS